MIIEQYGIKLKRIQYEDIELIRYWRNHPSIRKTMSLRKHITKSMQIDWFKSVNNQYNYYFLIEYNNENIGVINCKKINLKDGYGEGGIFMWERDLENEYIPVFASLCLLNFIFLVLKISNKSFVQILNSNLKAISFNSILGYIKIPGQEKNKNPYYILTKEDYISKTKKINEIAKKISGDGGLKIDGVISEANLSIINNLLSSKIKVFDV